MRSIPLVLVGGMLLSMAASVRGDELGDVRAELEQMRQRLNQQDQEIGSLRTETRDQKQEIQQLRSTNGESWLTERRTEEVKALVREVLSDADTRASLADGGMTAGHNGRHFFLASEDGAFLLNISGWSQIRYTYNTTNGAFSDLTYNPMTGAIDSDESTFLDHDEAGFNIRRAKIRFDGHIYDPRLTYAIQLNAIELTGLDDGDYNDVSIPNGDGDVNLDSGTAFSGLGAGSIPFVEEVWLAYAFADGWRVKIGQFKAPFLREEAVDGAHQLAVERSMAADLFTIDYTQGVQVSYDGEVAGTPMRAAVMLHDGSYQAGAGYDSDVTEIAIAARVEFLVAGDWRQFDDFQAWSGDQFGVLVGGAIDYEEGEGGLGTMTYDVFKWTIDASIEIPEVSGLSIYGAVIGNHIDNNDDSALTDDADQIAFVLQAGVFVIPDKWDVYARYEFIDLDEVVFFNFPAGHVAYPAAGPIDDTLNILTFGTNYYFHGHAAKASFDILWMLDEMPYANTSQGSRASVEDDQVTLRAQLQFMF